MTNTKQQYLQCNQLHQTILSTKPKLQPQPILPQKQSIQTKMQPQIQTILDKTILHGKILYLIIWKGDFTEVWEKDDNIKGDNRKLVQSFEEMHKNDILQKNIQKNKAKNTTMFDKNLNTRRGRKSGKKQKINEDSIKTDRKIDTSYKTQYVEQGLEQKQKLNASNNIFSFSNNKLKQEKNSSKAIKSENIESLLGLRQVSSSSNSSDDIFIKNLKRLVQKKGNQLKTDINEDKIIYNNQNQIKIVSKKQYRIQQNENNTKKSGLQKQTIQQYNKLDQPPQNPPNIKKELIQTNQKQIIQQQQQQHQKNKLVQQQLQQRLIIQQNKNDNNNNVNYFSQIKLQRATFSYQQQQQKHPQQRFIIQQVQNSPNNYTKHQSQNLPQSSKQQHIQNILHQINPQYFQYYQYHQSLLKQNRDQIIKSITPQPRDKSISQQNINFQLPFIILRNQRKLTIQNNTKIQQAPVSKPKRKYKKRRPKNQISQQPVEKIIIKRSRHSQKHSQKHVKTQLNIYPPSQQENNIQNDQDHEIKPIKKRIKQSLKHMYIIRQANKQRLSQKKRGRKPKPKNVIVTQPCQGKQQQIVNDKIIDREIQQMKKNSQQSQKKSQKSQIYLQEQIVYNEEQDAGIVNAMCQQVNNNPTIITNPKDNNQNQQQQQKQDKNQIIQKNHISQIINNQGINQNQNIKNTNDQINQMQQNNNQTYNHKIQVNFFNQNPPPIINPQKTRKKRKYNFKQNKRKYTHSHSLQRQQPKPQIPQDHLIEQNNYDQNVPMFDIFTNVRRKPILINQFTQTDYISFNQYRQDISKKRRGKKQQKIKKSKKKQINQINQEPRVSIIEDDNQEQLLMPLQNKQQQKKQRNLRNKRIKKNQKFEVDGNSNSQQIYIPKIKQTNLLKNQDFKTQYIGKKKEFIQRRDNNESAIQIQTDSQDQQRKIQQLNNSNKKSVNFPNHLSKSFDWIDKISGIGYFNNLLVVKGKTAPTSINVEDQRKQYQQQSEQILIDYQVLKKYNPKLLCKYLQNCNWIQLQSIKQGQIIQK